MENNKMKKEIGKKMKKARLLRGFTQAEVAKYIKKSTQSISDWECGRRSPAMLDFIQLCRVLRLDLINE